MNDEQFNRELCFQTSACFIDTMLRQGLISESDHRLWREKLIEKYSPPVGKIVSNRRENFLDFQGHLSDL